MVHRGRAWRAVNVDVVLLVTIPIVVVSTVIRVVVVAFALVVPGGVLFVVFSVVRPVLVLPKGTGKEPERNNHTNG